MKARRGSSVGVHDALQLDSKGASPVHMLITFRLTRHGYEERVARFLAAC